MRPYTFQNFQVPYWHLWENLWYQRQSRMFLDQNYYYNYRHANFKSVPTIGDPNYPSFAQTRKYCKSRNTPPDKILQNKFKFQHTSKLVNKQTPITKILNHIKLQSLLSGHMNGTTIKIRDFIRGEVEESQNRTIELSEVPVVDADSDIPSVDAVSEVRSVNSISEMPMVETNSEMPIIDTNSEIPVINSISEILIQNCPEPENEHSSSLPTINSSNGKNKKKKYPVKKKGKRNKSKKDISNNIPDNSSVNQTHIVSNPEFGEQHLNPIHNSENSEDDCLSEEFYEFDSYGNKVKYRTITLAVSNKTIKIYS